MANVTITCDFTETIPAQNQFSVAANADPLGCVNIEPEVFYFDVEHQAFTGVCTIYEMETFPNARQAAIDAGLAYYRGQGFLRTFDNVADAQDFVTLTKSRLTKLQKDFEIYINGFVADETFIVPPPG